MIAKQNTYFRDFQLQSNILIVFRFGVLLVLHCVYDDEDRLTCISNLTLCMHVIIIYYYYNFNNIMKLIIFHILL